MNSYNNEFINVLGSTLSDESGFCFFVSPSEGGGQESFQCRDYVIVPHGELSDEQAKALYCSCFPDDSSDLKVSFVDIGEYKIIYPVQLEGVCMERPKVAELLEYALNRCSGNAIITEYADGYTQLVAMKENRLIYAGSVRSDSDFESLYHIVNCIKQLSLVGLEIWFAGYAPTVEQNLAQITGQEIKKLFL